MQPNKAHLRTSMLEQRNALPTLEVLKKSDEIISRLQKLPSFMGASTILTYISFGTEVNTHGLIKSMLTDKNIKVLVPVVSDREKRLLSFTTLNDWADLTTGTYGILEPRESTRVLRPSEDLDLALIPGLVFDLEGNRIGYGGGYFDRLLRTITGKKVGLAYDFQVLDHVPYERYDEQVNIVLTDKRVINCD